MSVPSSDYDNWDEFAWERELRREEARIAAYMDELPGLLDLPGESELLRKRLEKHPELVGESGFWADFDWDDDDDDDDEPRASMEEWKDRDGAGIYLDLAALATSASGVLASLPGKINLGEGPYIICLYGRLMSWSMDLVDLGKNELPAFKIALCKRLVDGINQMLGVVDGVRAKIPSREGELAAQLEKLRKIRGVTVDLLNSLRAGGQ